MKKILIKIGVIAFIIGGLVAVLWPVDTWRMYDANWQPLAMTESEAFCAGFLLGDSGFNNVQDEEGMQVCMERFDDKSDTPSVGIVISAFCDGLWVSAGFPKTDCEDVTEGYEIWPLQHGGYTWEWNDTNSRPEVVQSNISQAPRREGRDEDNRNETGRGIGE